MTGYDSYVFNFKDTLSAGLTFKGITSVTVGETEITKVDAGQEANNTYTLKQDGQKITITMNNFFASYRDKAGQEIKVTYTATLNKDAVTGFDPNTNKATVEYSNKPGTNEKGESEPSIVDVYTFNFTIFKYYLKDDVETGLANAEFELYKANGEVAGEKVNIKKVTERIFCRKNLNPQIHDTEKRTMMEVPEGVDAELLAKVLSNPEMAVLLTSLAKSMQGEHN